MLHLPHVFGQECTVQIDAEGKLLMLLAQAKVFVLSGIFGGLKTMKSRVPNSLFWVEESG